MDVTNKYLNILNDIKKIMCIYTKESSKSYLFHTHNKIKIYVNREGTYFTADIGGKKFNIRVVKGHVLLDTSYTYNDKVELLIIDALESTFIKLSKLSQQAIGDYDNLVNSLFSNLVKKRGLALEKDLSELIQDNVKTYI